MSRVKCDERRDTCCPCSRLRLRCEWADRPAGCYLGPDATRTSDPMQWSGTKLACTECRQRRTKCKDSKSVDSRCDTCVRVGSACTRNRRKTCHSLSQTSAENSLINDQAVQEPYPKVSLNAIITDRLHVHGHKLHRLLDLYFQGPHPFCFYSFIRRSMLMQMQESRLAPRHLILALMSTSLRTFNPTDTRVDVQANES